jgi:hypothetical protein
MSDHFSTISINPDPAPQPPQVTRPPRKREPAGKKILESLLPRNPYLITALIVALLFGIYCGGGFLLVPPLLKGSLIKYFQKNTEMELTIGKTEFNPFNFHLHLAELSINHDPDAKKEPVVLKAADLLINVDPIALLRNNLACKALQIDKLSVNIIRYSDKKYNVSQVFKTSASTPSTDILDFANLPFLFSINNISITDSSVIFDDRTAGKVHKIEKIALALPTLSNFSYQVKNSTTPRFSAMVNGSPVQLTGEAAIPGDKEGDQTRLSFDLHSLDLPLYSGYLPLALPVQLVKGTADGKIQVSFAQEKDHSRRLTVLFQMATKDIEILSKDQSLAMTIPTAKLEGDMQPLTGDLHLESMLFHEPVIHLKKNFSEETLNGLLPAMEESSPHSLASRANPLLSMDLFIMDNGILHIQETQGKKEIEKTYQTLQLSIKNYTNGPTASHDSNTTACSFKLSGEQPSPSASFSWQGTLDNAASGTLQLSRFPASLLGTIFTEEKETSMTGVADMTGNLSVKRNPNGKKLFSYSISDGSVKISDFGITEKQNEWLHATTLTMGPVDSKDKILDIGNILLQKAVVTLYRDHLPPFLESFTKKGSNYKVHGIDFSGNFILKSSENTKTPLILNDLSMQANNLEKDAKDKENFAVTGKIGQSGELKAKGTVVLGPFRSSLAVEFSGMQSKELFPWYTDAPFLLEGQAKMEGVGRLTYPENTYKGSLRISDARFENKPAKSALAWTSANFHDFSYTKKPFHVNIAIAEMDRPVLTYLQANEKTSVYEELALFIQGILPKKEAEKSPKATPAPTLQIKEVRIDKGTVIYKDLRLTPPWQQEISALQGNIRNVLIPSTGAAIDYTFSGSIAGRPLTIEGAADLFSSPLSTQSTVTLSAIPVAVYKDQLAPLLSIDPGKGTFDLTLKDDWKDGQEKGEAQYIFRGLSPSSPSSDTALPLALLNDKRDILELRVPLVDPEEKQPTPVFTDTVKYFKRLVVKSVVAPLLLTNENFSRLAFDDTPDFIDGESILSEKGKAKLTLYKDLLIAHPRLKLEITGLVDMVVDRRTLQEKLMLAEKKRVDAENLRRSQEWQRLQDQKQQKPGHRDTIVEKDIPADELAKFAPLFPKPIIVSDQALHELADQRAASASAFFTGELGLGTDRVMRHPNGQGQVMESINRVHIILHALASIKQPAPPTDQPPDDDSGD